jgi:hypothetical protein
MHLDHITIVAGDCRRLRDFFVEVAGLTGGPKAALRQCRPLALPRSAAGAASDRAPSPSASTGVQSANLRHASTTWRCGWTVPRNGSAAATLHGTPALSDETIDAGQERQLFVAPTPGVRVEFVIAERHLAAT